MGLIEDKLKGKAQAEKASLKAAEIAKLNFAGNHQKGDLSIEILSLEQIEGGVQIFARAFRGGKQIGFGNDGTVDIERFRFFNPPVLVPSGAKESVVTTTETYEKDVFEENAFDAVIETLAHTISLVAKDSNKIKQGKIGNTTDTFYATTGESIVVPENASWDAVHDATSGAVDTGDTTARGYISAGKYAIYRLGYTFDTSSIGDTDTIDSATFSGFVKDIYDSDNDGNDWINVVGPFTPANETSYAGGDFDQMGAINNPTEYSTRKDLTSDFTDESYADFAFNAAGLAIISKTGNTLFSVREGHDCVDNAFSAGVFTGVRFQHVSFAGTTQDPKLVVTHTTPIVTRLTATGRLAATGRIGASGRLSASSRRTV